MIQTPLGIIEIIKDGENTDCSIRKMRNEPMLRIELTICNFG